MGLSRDLSRVKDGDGMGSILLKFGLQNVGCRVRLPDCQSGAQIGIQACFIRSSGRARGGACPRLHEAVTSSVTLWSQRA